MCEASTTLKTEKRQEENILLSKFSGFPDHCSQFMAKKVCTLCMMSIRGKEFDIFVSMKLENFYIVLLPEADVS